MERVTRRLSFVCVCVCRLRRITNRFNRVSNTSTSLCWRKVSQKESDDSCFDGAHFFFHLIAFFLSSRNKNCRLLLSYVNFFSVVCLVFTHTLSKMLLKRISYWLFIFHTFAFILVKDRHLFALNCVHACNGVNV